MLGDILTDLGRLQDAEAALLAADAVWATMRKQPQFPALPAFFLGPLYLEMGKDAEAAKFADVASNVVAKLEGQIDPCHFYECMNVQMEAAVRKMKSESGKDCGLYMFMEMGVSDVTRFRSVTGMARMHLQDGAPAEAERKLGPAYAKYKELLQRDLKHAGTLLRKALVAMRVLVEARRARAV